jgi:hypothetical protein
MMLEILKALITPGKWYVYENKIAKPEADLDLDPDLRVTLLVDQRKWNDSIRLFRNKPCPNEIGTISHLPYLIAHTSPIPEIPERFFLVHLPSPHPRNIGVPIPRGWKQADKVPDEGTPILLPDPWTPGGWGRHPFKKEYGPSCPIILLRTTSSESS